jgi:hypothetical protein
MKWHVCGKCPIGSYARRKPDSLIARFWRWHTRWCPGWRAYQKALQATDAPGKIQGGN